MLGYLGLCEFHLKKRFIYFLVQSVSQSERENALECISLQKSVYMTMIEREERKK